MQMGEEDAARSMSGRQSSSSLSSPSSLVLAVALEYCFCVVLRASSACSCVVGS